VGGVVAGVVVGDGFGVVGAGPPTGGAAVIGAAVTGGAVTGATADGGVNDLPVEPAGGVVAEDPEPGTVGSVVRGAVVAVACGRELGVVRGRDPLGRPERGPTPPVAGGAPVAAVVLRAATVTSAALDGTAAEPIDAMIDKKPETLRPATRIRVAAAGWRRRGRLGAGDALPLFAAGDGRRAASRARRSSTSSGCVTRGAVSSWRGSRARSRGPGVGSSFPRVQ